MTFQHYLSRFQFNSCLKKINILSDIPFLKHQLLSMFNKILAIFALASVFTVASAGLSCMDREGNPVSWFTFIKYPENMTYDGARYAYLDANLGKNYKIILGSHADDEDEALPNTIAAINGIPEESINLYIYNDEPANTPYNPDGGHAKGFIAFDNVTQTGIYVMHSLPKFPNVTDSGYIQYKFPKNTFKYGQNGYCLTLDKESLGHLVDNLPVEAPNVYYASGLFKYLQPNSEEPHKIAQFNVENGDTYWYLTKNPTYAGFLYDDIIAPYFQTSLAVESWGRPYQDSQCSGSYASLNIDQIAFNTEDTWNHYSDHSKWAITVGNSGLNLACLCDMNRMTTQQRRGGSCLCSSNPNLYNALSSIVVVTDKCTSHNKRREHVQI